MQRITNILLVAITLTLIVPGVGRAQGAPSLQEELLNSRGFRADRNYLSLQPWEAIDPVAGSVVLSFTDLTLPGNAGRSLRFQRTFNSKGAPFSPLIAGAWTFGISGMPMRILNPSADNTANWEQEFDGLSGPEVFEKLAAFTPTLQISDGSIKRTMYVQNPTADAATRNEVRAGNFYRLYRDQNRIDMPDGTRAYYLTDGRLWKFEDPFGNMVFLQHLENQIRVNQDVGGTTRVVVLDLDALGRPWRMQYLDRVWTYEYGPLNTMDLQAANLPEGVSWQFTPLPGDDGFTVTTPTGGTVSYYFDDVSFTVPQPIGTVTVNTLVQRTARTNDPGSTPSTWTIAHESDTAGVVYQASVTGPSGRTIVYTWDVTPIDSALDGGIAGNTVTISGAGVSEAVATHYEGRPTGPAVRGLVPQSPVLTSRTITRTQGAASRSYVSEQHYHTADFSDYHHPWEVIERVDGVQVRRTTRAFKVPAESPYFLAGLVEGEAVDIAGALLVKGWAYNASTGFKESETVAGITTTFDPDPYGNVATITKANGTQTSFSYEYGQVKNTITDQYTIEREINPDGTVASEKQAGRTTVYTYDKLGRVRVTTPPGPVNPINVNYPTNKTIVTTRGASEVTTWLDGFGRPIRTENGANVVTMTEYDAEGRVIRQSLPYINGQPTPMTTIEYDALDRVTKEINPGGASYRQRTYGIDTVAVRDEENHTTVYTRQAFGHPEDARLVRVVDAAGEQWDYTYTVAGALAGVAGPDDVTRTWTYNAQHLLATETHPESGAVIYTYDAAGLLATKQDANETVFAYSYDDNDRLTRIEAGAKVTEVEYEPGSDNRALARVVGDVTTAFHYDGGGRLDTRTDTVDGIPFQTRYHYDQNDNRDVMTYPSGRQVEYEYDAENRLTAARNRATDDPYVSNVQYHPSGAVKSYVGGNGLVTTFDFDADRYWVTSINSGPLHLTYDYDDVGNVIEIGDSRPGMTQLFEYDALDRLATAQSTGSVYPATINTYDAHGNRTGSGLTYAPTNRFRLVNSSGLQMAYDNNGNMTSAGDATYTPTPDNLLARAQKSGSDTRFTYDADAWRVKTLTGSTPTYFIRGASGALLTEFETGPDAKTRDHIYLGSRPIAIVEKAAASNPPPSGPGATLSSGQTLNGNESRTSANGQHTLVYQQSDGNFVLYSGAPAWWSGTEGSSVGFVAMQSDGNLVMYSATSAVLCSSGTNGHPGAYLVVEDSGRAAIYDANGTVLRDTATTPGQFCALPEP